MRSTANPLAALRPHRATRVIAIACALAVWLLGVLAMSPDLHGHVHTDADTPEHGCAVTLFQHGAENPADAVALRVAPAVFAVGELVLVERVVVAAADLRLQPSCGPPAR